MFWTKAFIPTLKEIPEGAQTASHSLLVRGGFIRMLIAGVYTYLPLGWKVLNNIEKIIRQEMDASGAQELLLSALQPQELWINSGRNKEIGQVMFRFADRRGRNLCLGPTHEEIITDLAKKNIFSYRQLPLILYQIQVKFRDEIRPRFGLLRSCEFIMKDAYSFDCNEEGLKMSYKKMRQTYARIFKRLGLTFVEVEADPGLMGGGISHEFMAVAAAGEDIVKYCKSCKYSVSSSVATSRCPNCSRSLEKINAIEIGHIFQLGTKYSGIQEAHFLNAEGKEKPLIMGCYGMGVSRIISAIIEQNNDEDGIIWPTEVSPYKIIILPLERNGRVYEVALDIYNSLKEDFELLMDERDEYAGIKFKDADLIGIPLQIIISSRLLRENKIELKIRRTGERRILKSDKIDEVITTTMKDIGPI